MKLARIQDRLNISELNILNEVELLTINFDQNIKLFAIDGCSVIAWMCFAEHPKCAYFRLQMSMMTTHHVAPHPPKTPLAYPL